MRANLKASRLRLMFSLFQHIPPLIIAACGGLILLFLIFALRMALDAARVRRDIAGLVGILDHLPQRNLETRREGLHLADLERVRAASHGVTVNAKRLWTDVENALEPYRGSGDAESWFVVRPLAEVLPESAVIDRTYHASFHQSVPGLLTALGLMTTFIAILLALDGLRVEVRGGTEIVGGIGALINGLAGKFVSSIAALFLAVAFTVLEKRTERSLEARYDDLLRKAAGGIPALSTSRVLLDMQALSARRTALLERFYAETADRLVSLIRTQVLPEISADFGDEIARRTEAQLSPVVQELGQRASELAMAAINSDGHVRVSPKESSECFHETDAAGDGLHPAPEAPVESEARL